jgi:hypothetical protein
VVVVVDENKLGLEKDVVVVSLVDDDSWLSKRDLPNVNKLFGFGDCSNKDLVCVVVVVVFEKRDVVVVEESNVNFG